MTDREWFVYVDHNAHRLKMLFDQGQIGLRDEDQRELQRILASPREEDVLFIERFYDTIYATIQRLQLIDAAMEMVTGRSVEWAIPGMPIDTTDDDGDDIEAQVAIANDLATDIAEAIENAVKAWLKERKAS